MQAVEMVQPVKPADAHAIRRNQLKLLGIFAVALVPVALAFVMYFGGWAVPSDKTNKGNLIWPPADIATLSTLQAEGSVALTQQIQESGKWMILITGIGPCDTQCEELVHLTRQVNIAMGKEAHRVGRLLVSTNAVADLTRLDDTAAPVRLHHASESAIQSFQQRTAELGAKPDANWQIWLVDPLGNVPIQYGTTHTGYDMIDDLKRLLKLSQIG
jgi:hypothetical protein